MSRKYTEEELVQIAEWLVDDLRECEDGTDITTCQLLKLAGYGRDEFDTYDLFKIHDALFKAARRNHITLDMSSHKDKVEGLPFNLDFIVRNKKAQIKCPYCGSRNTARILYGMPAFSEALEKKIDSGKVSLGGCCIMDVPVGDKRIQIDPARKCNECKKEFGTPPFLVARDYSSAEDYRDIVTSIHFLEGGYFGGASDITITRNEKGALVKVICYPDIEKSSEEKQISRKAWNRIVDTLYSRMYLHEWRKKYVELGICDGTQWELNIKLTGKRKRNYDGSNMFPSYWPELIKLFKKYM